MRQHSYRIILEVHTLNSLTTILQALDGAATLVECKELTNGLTPRGNVDVGPPRHRIPGIRSVDMLYNEFKMKKQLTFAQITALFRSHGLSARSASPRLHELITEGKVIRIGPETYKLVEKP